MSAKRIQSRSSLGPNSRSCFAGTVAIPAALLLVVGLATAKQSSGGAADVGPVVCTGSIQATWEYSVFPTDPEFSDGRLVEGTITTDAVHLHEYRFAALLGTRRDYPDLSWGGEFQVTPTEPEDDGTFRVLLYGTLSATNLGGDPYQTSGDLYIGEAVDAGLPSSHFVPRSILHFSGSTTHRPDKRAIAWDLAGINPCIGNGIDTANPVQDWKPIADAGVRYFVAKSWGGWPISSTNRNAAPNIRNATTPLPAARFVPLSVGAFALLNFNSANMTVQSQIEQAFRNLEDQVVKTKFLAIDVENVRKTRDHPANYPPKLVTGALKEKRALQREIVHDIFDAVRSVSDGDSHTGRQSMMPVIYTAWDDWELFTGNTTVFSRMGVPLWDSPRARSGEAVGHDGIPQREVDNGFPFYSLIPDKDRSFGGWTERAGKQHNIGHEYANKGAVGTMEPFGQAMIDLNEFDPRLFEGGLPGPQRPTFDCASHLVRAGSSVVAEVIVANHGTLTATDVRILNATLSGVAVKLKPSHLPLSLGDIAPGDSRVVRLLFPPNAVHHGAVPSLVVQGDWEGSSFACSSVPQ